MSNEPAQQLGLLSDVSRNLGAIIRHTLAGVIVVGGVRLAYPETFCTVHFDSWRHLVVLAVITITVGNALFALNRCGVHQIVERIFYWLKIEGPIPGTEHLGYTHDLAEFVVESFQTGDHPQRVREHIHFRVSTAFLLLTLSETALVFSCAHSNSSKLTGHILWLRVVFVAALGSYIWQSIITRRIDYFVVKKLIAHPEKEQNSGPDS